MTKEQIGQAVRALRKKNGISTTVLEKEKGIHPKYIAIIEKAKGEDYQLGTFLKYIAACGITLKQVVNYKPKNEE